MISTCYGFQIELESVYSDSLLFMTGQLRNTLYILGLITFSGHYVYAPPDRRKANSPIPHIIYITLQLIPDICCMRCLDWTNCSDVVSPLKNHETELFHQKYYTGRWVTCLIPRILTSVTPSDYTSLVIARQDSIQIKLLTQNLKIYRADLSNNSWTFLTAAFFIACCDYIYYPSMVQASCYIQKPPTDLTA